MKVQSKALLCSRWLHAIAGSNPASDVYIRLLRVLRVEQVETSKGDRSMENGKSRRVSVSKCDEAQRYTSAPTLSRFTWWCIWLRHCCTRIRFPVVTLEFFNDIILPTAIWPWGLINI